MQRQRLKPVSFQTPNGTVETVPNKDFGVLTQTPEPGSTMQTAAVTSARK